MAKIPENENTTLARINRALEESQSVHPRTYLGASAIGEECRRKLWYGFRWVKAIRHPGRILRLFERGHLEEPRFVKWLEMIGAKVTDDQQEVVAFGGHFRGHIDGRILGLPESKQEHLAEYKTHAEKSFNEVKKKGVKAAKPVHYVQMQLYMTLLGLKRALYAAINKNNDELYFERVKVDPDEAERCLLKAESIIFTDEPLERISEDATFFKCKWCDYQDECHYQALPQANCRTCAHSTAERNGTWICSGGNSNIIIDVERQRIGCTAHVFNPYLVPLEFKEGNGTSATYIKPDGGTVTNGPEHLNAKEFTASVQATLLSAGGS